MSFGLPTHLARAANRSAIANAAQWGGIVCLVAALATVLFTAAAGGATAEGAGVWPTIIAIIPMMVLLVILRRVGSVPLTVAYLVVGAFGTFLYTLTLLTQTPTFRMTDLFVVALPVIAMIAVGGAGSGAFSGVLWSTAGYVLSEGAVLVAAMMAGRAFIPEPISLLAYLGLVTIMIVDTIVGSGRHAPQTMLHRGIRDVHASRVRHELAVEFASDLHDAVLSELVTVAASVPGELSPRLRRLIELDLAELGRDAASVRAGEGGRGPSDADAWLASELHNAIELSRDDGLSVTVSGDRGSLAGLTGEQDRALGLAVRQCLVNVLRHSGTIEADVAISADDAELSVMVVDAGRGFVPAETAADRLGLRASVQERIEHAGGTVTIWSKKGVGTTVMIALPVSPGAGAALASHPDPVSDPDPVATPNQAKNGSPA